MTIKKHKILVSGASGQLGQLILAELIKKAPKEVQIVAGTRSTEKLKEFENKGIELREVDFNNVEQTQKALAGIDQFLIISTDSIGSRFEQHKNAIDAAKKNNVKRVLYTSWPNPQDSVAMVAPEHSQTEGHLKDSGLSYVLLRNSLYSENLIGTIQNALESGTIYGSAADGKHTYISRIDCAKAAASALLNEKLENKIFNITGPASYSYADIAKILTTLGKKEVQYFNLTDDEFQQVLEKSGLPTLWAQLFVSFDQANRANEASSPSNDVKFLSNSDPERLEEFLKKHFFKEYV